MNITHETNKNYTAVKGTSSYLANNGYRLQTCQNRIEKKIENSKLSHKAHRMFIRKFLTSETDLWYSQYSSTKKLEKICLDEKQNGRDSRHLFRKYFQKYSTSSILRPL